MAVLVGSAWQSWFAWSPRTSWTSRNNWISKGPKGQYPCMNAVSRLIFFTIQDLHDCCLQPLDELALMCREVVALMDSLECLARRYTPFIVQIRTLSHHLHYIIMLLIGQQRSTRQSWNARKPWT